MSDRLLLNTVGIKSAAEPRDGDAPSGHRSGPPARPPHLRAVESAAAPARPRRTLKPRPIISEPPATRPPVSTLKLERDLANKLEATARAAGVASDVLAIATLERALEAEPDRLRATDTRPRGRGRARLRDVHLSRPVGERANDLVRRDEPPSPIARARLLNDALRRGLPDDPRVALAMVIVAATAARVSTR